MSWQWINKSTASLIPLGFQKPIEGYLILFKNIKTSLKQTSTQKGTQDSLQTHNVGTEGELPAEIASLLIIHS